MAERRELVAALRGGQRKAAARHAADLARDGAWDGVVAATIFLHGRPGSPEHERAAAWLEAVVGAARVHAEPDSQEAWTALLGALVNAERIDDARAGLELAAAAGLAGAAVWHATARACHAGDERAAARAMLEAAVARHPEDAALWSSLALARIEAGEREAAAGACGRALALAPEAPGPLLSAALLAGDPGVARELLDEARRRGAPEYIVDGFRNAVK